MRAARVYDYVPGGKNNYPADREVAEAVLARTPSLRPAVRANRSFLRRAVRYVAAEAGIRQIIDLGAGLPTVGNTHAGRKPWRVSLTPPGVVPFARLRRPGGQA